VRTNSYNLVHADLRDINALKTILIDCGIDFNIPTLLLSECVLIYLEPQYSSLIIEWSAQVFTTSVFLTYEQIRPDDSFGSVMLKNLENRGCSLLSIKAYPDLNSQRQRFLSLGWNKVDAEDMNTIYNILIEKTEALRISRLQFLDDHHEFAIMQSHYCIVVAFQTKDNSEIWKKHKIDVIFTGHKIRIEEITCICSK